VELRKKVCSDKTEVANALLKTESSSRIKGILQELFTLLYETNIRLINSKLMYEYIIDKLKKSVNKGRLVYQAQNSEWSKTYKEKQVYRMSPTKMG
jgi:phosphoribosyl-ATP pyrophosphohydrolase